MVPKCSTSSSFHLQFPPQPRLHEIERRLEEDKRDRWAINGVSPEDFLYGEYDGHHTYQEGHEGTFWEGLVADYQAGEPPIDLQGLISRLFPPAMIAAMAFHVPVINISSCEGMGLHY